MKLHLIVVALAVTISACRSPAQSSPPRPPVDYANETNPWACMIESDMNKRSTCLAITHRNPAFCDSTTDANQRAFCNAAVQQRMQK